MFIELLVSTMFMASAVSKMFTFHDFREGVKALMPFDWPLPAGLLAYMVTIAELTGGCCVLNGNTYWWGVGCLTGLLCLFTIVIAIHLRRKSTISCHCGGFLGNETIKPSLLIRNIVIIGLILFQTFVIHPVTVMPLHFHRADVYVLVMNEVSVILLLTLYRFVQRIRIELNEVQFHV